MGRQHRWDDASKDNGGRPAWQWSIDDRLPWPKRFGTSVYCGLEDEMVGITVTYGQQESGKWAVRLDLDGEGYRKSPDLSEADARKRAEHLARALEFVWPYHAPPR